MPRHNGRQDREELQLRLYQRDLDRWGDWLQQQDRLRALLPKALDVLEDALDAGDAQAVTLALAVVKLTKLSEPVAKPQTAMLGFVGEAELRARLAAHGGEDDPPALASGKE